MNKDNTYQYRLSVIVAIYNVEPYLERCLESIVHQDLSKDEYEVLLINDGSTDRSLEIAKRYEAEYTNFIVYSKENGGLSSVRNFGIEHSHGRFIMHVDADDFLEENVIGKVVKVAEDKELDLCFFRYISHPDGRKIDLFWNFSKYKLYTGEWLLLNNMKVTSTWCGIYNHSFLDKSGIEYFGRISHQDVEYNYRLYPLAKRVMFTDYYVYHYSIEGESITRTKDIKKKQQNLLDNLQIAHNIKNYANSGKCNTPIRRFLNRKMNSIVVAFLLSFLRKENTYSYGFIKEFINQAEIKGVYPCGRTYSWKTTVLLLLVNIKPLYLLSARILNSSKNC
ncbi:MAG: glycosyltransferase [Prevotella sp.]|nr:glycosyltransferase [Prevotella sp.]